MSDSLQGYRRLRRIIAGGCVLAAMTFAALLIMCYRTGYWRWRNPWEEIWDRITMRRQTGCRINDEEEVIQNLSTLLYVFQGITGRIPSQEEGLQVLMKEKRSSTGTIRPGLIGNLPLDRWGRPYQYRVPALYSKAGYDLFSLGPDGVVSQDDIGNWE